MTEILFSELHVPLEIKNIKHFILEKYEAIGPKS